MKTSYPPFLEKRPKLLHFPRICSIFSPVFPRAYLDTHPLLDTREVYPPGILNSFYNLKDTRVRINQAIRAKELRVIGVDGENLGVIPLQEALDAAETAGVDLIEISPDAKPPVAKIMDFGKYQYELKKKAKEVKAKSHVTETKGIQVKIGTGEHDLTLKAKRAAAWLEEGHRVKVDLFLWGRYKYMEEGFLKERLERFLKLIPADYKVADEMKKSPKGYAVTLERAAKTKTS